MLPASDRLLRGLAITLATIGGGTLGFALMAHRFGLGGEAGLGLKQALVAALGGVSVALGALLALPASRRYIRAWRPAPALTQPPGSVFLLATWFGLLAGMADAVSLLEDRHLSRKMLFQGPDFVWMAPLANVALFLLAAGVLVLAGRRWPRLGSFKAVVFVLALLLHYSVLLKIAGLHQAAALLLAAGLGKVTADLTGRYPAILYFVVEVTLRWPGAVVSGLGRRRRLARRPASAAPEGGSVTRREFLLSAGAMVGGLFLAVRGSERWQEAQRWAGLGPARAGAPNVLLIVLDTVRAKSTSLHGYVRPTTPNLERLARRGTHYTRAFATAPWTLPSHASMFTGRLPHELSVGWVAPLDLTYPTLAEVLAAAGYATAGFVANTKYCSAEFGLPRGFCHYEDYRIAPGQALDSAFLTRSLAYTVRESLGNYDQPDRKSAGELTRAFRAWLGQQAPEQPFFAFLNYFDAHAPYLPPLEFAQMFGSERPSARLPVGPDLVPVSGPALKDMQDAYDGAIAYLDHHLGTLVDALEQRGGLDNTLVIVTSDHGEQFGEHGLVDHSGSLYTQLLHVPLVMSFPADIVAVPQVAAPVSLRDLPATVFDVLGLEQPAGFPGQSLLRRSLGAGADSGGPIVSEAHKALAFPAWYPAMQGPMRSVVAEGKHYIRNLGTGAEELYDLEQDLEEEHDLAATVEGQRSLPHFRALLDEAWRE
jgi:arylsulfatase A-like enzyme